jgi:hypothetical protein
MPTANAMERRLRFEAGRFDRLGNLRGWSLPEVSLLYG